jgi:hypothetical protein
MVASGLWYDSEGDEEGEDAFPLVITWSSWAGTEDAQPQGLEAAQTGFLQLPVST